MSRGGPRTPYIYWPTEKAIEKAIDLLRSASSPPAGAVEGPIPPASNRDAPNAWDSDGQPGDSTEAADKEAS